MLTDKDARHELKICGFTLAYAHSETAEHNRNQPMGSALLPKAFKVSNYSPTSAGTTDKIKYLPGMYLRMPKSPVALIELAHDSFHENDRREPSNPTSIWIGLASLEDMTRVNLTNQSSIFEGLVGEHAADPLQRWSFRSFQIT
jgi:hypothetical protein